MAMQWRIVSQRPTERLTASGAFESVVTVSFETANGTPGHVVIPARLYAPDYVRDRVSEAAATMIAIESMEG